MIIKLTIRQKEISRIVLGTLILAALGLGLLNWVFSFFYKVEYEALKINESTPAILEALRKDKISQEQISSSSQQSSSNGLMERSLTYSSGMVQPQLPPQSGATGTDKNEAVPKTGTTVIQMSKEELKKLGKPISPPGQ